MKPLFECSMAIEGKNLYYQVLFANEEYFFQPSGSHDPSFRLRRLHDEWITMNDISNEMKTQAVLQLEQYLLRQH